MRHTVKLAAAILLSTGIAGVRAQITSPDKLVGHPPPNPADHAPIKPADDMQWIWAYTTPVPNGRATDLRMDARFQLLLRNNFHRPQAMWGKNESLDSVIPLFLSRYGTVTAESNRYVAIDGCVPSFCPAHGLLWMDLGTQHPLIVFAAVNWTAQGHTTDEATANYDLWLYPNRELSGDALPFALTDSLAHWDARLAAAHRLVPHIAHAVLVEPTGAPYALQPAVAGANTLAPQPDTTAEYQQQPHSGQLKPRNARPESEHQP